MDPKLRTLLEAMDISFDQIRQKLGSKVGSGTWVRDVYDSWFVHQNDEDGLDGKSYRRSYVVDKETGEVTVGEPTEVVGQMVWMSVGQEAAADLGVEYVQLVEKAIRSDGTLPIKLIAPGWGSSGYYPADVLERDGPKVFKKGLHTYWNHPSLSEERDRPERDLKDLAGVLTSDAVWRANGVDGPGLYGEAKIVTAYQSAVNDLAPDIGLSIRAYGKVTEGDVDGKRGKIIAELAGARSVDFVTAAGAGGKVVELFESAGRSPLPEGVEVVTEEEKTALLAENARLTAQVAEFTRLALVERAKGVATEVLQESELPQTAKDRVLATAILALPLQENNTLDEPTFTTAVREAAVAEKAYVDSIRGPSGTITGMGSTPRTSDSALYEAFYTRYKLAGLSDEDAKARAQVAASGR